MSLVVHTLTRNLRPDWLREACQSVADNLPADAQHFVIHCDGDFAAKRWEALHLGEFVAAVDDDDRVVGDGLKLCVRALNMTGAGIAFTYEGQINDAGDQIEVQHGPKALMDVAMHPRSLHHLAVIRRAALDDKLYDYACEFGVGIDWLTKAWCALKYGAVQVPVVGYEWRRHEGAMSLTEEPAFSRSMNEIRKLTMSWKRHDARIRQLLPR